MATSNFLAWANGANIETDAQWLTDTLRTGDIPVNAALPSPMLNKLFRQATVFVAAMAQALVAKGYSCSDADQNALAAVLSNIVTQYDLAHSPALAGNPTATTQGSSDNSTKIATTAFVQAWVATLLADISAAQSNAENYAKSLLANFVLNGGNPGYFQIPAIGGFPGLMIQFGSNAVAGTPFSSSITFAASFPNAALAAAVAPQNNNTVAVIGLAVSTITLQGSNATGAYWIAIGY